MLNYDPQQPHAHLSVETLRSWRDAVVEATEPLPEDSTGRDDVLRRMHQAIDIALRSHNPPTGEWVVQGGMLLRVLANCNCSPHFGAHQPECQLDPFGPAEDFVLALRKGGYIVIPPDEIAEAFNEAPADVDECSCDTGPDTEGPSIDCPKHGESEVQREEREHRQLREGNWTRPKSPEHAEEQERDRKDAMRRMGMLMQHPTSHNFHMPVRDEVGDRTARLREHAQRLARIGHDLRSPELLAASRDIAEHLGPGWSAEPTVEALSSPERSAGPQDTQEPLPGAPGSSQPPNVHRAACPTHGFWQQETTPSGATVVTCWEDSCTWAVVVKNPRSES